MEVLESYQELIEANSNEISIWWKLLPITFYLLNAISSYAASILFYILWHEIFAANCPLWAEIVSPIRPRIMPDDVPIEVLPTPVAPDWRRKILVVYKYGTRCEFYYFITLCSCWLGVTWSVLFAMCGKGGYDTRTFVAPWRVVPPALILQFLITVLTMIAVNDLEYGYSHFAKRLFKVASYFNDTELATRKRPCDIVQHFVEIYGMDKHTVCTMYPVLQALSWIMALTWFFGLIVLTLRLISINDFNMLTVKIHKVPEDEVHKYIPKKESTQSAESVREEPN